MRLKINFFILVITTEMITLGCKENNNSTPITILIPDTLKKACFFRKDSYWIYRNDSTGEIDSTYVSGDPITGYVDGYYYNSLAEFIKMPLESSILWYLYLEGEPNFEPPRIGRLLTRTHLQNPFTVCGNVVSYPIYSDSSIKREEDYYCTVSTGHNNTSVWGGTYTVLQTFTEFHINDILFNQVILTRFKYDHRYPVESNQDSLDFYFSPGNGFAKLIFRADTSNNISVVKRATISWSLLRYHLVK